MLKLTEINIFSISANVLFMLKKLKLSNRQCFFSKGCPALSINWKDFAYERRIKGNTHAAQTLHIKRASNFLEPHRARHTGVRCTKPAQTVHLKPHTSRVMRAHGIPTRTSTWFSARYAQACPRGITNPHIKVVSAAVRASGRAGYRHKC